jgi:mono/diheme cytochrome c family protein
MLKWTTLTCALPLLLAGCAPGPKSARGFRLPDGDPQVGRAVFAELRCVACHTVEGAELQVAEERNMDVHLGGKVHRVRTYGELVTAVIHPSHDIAKGQDEPVVTPDGKSLMTDFNDVMTVQQMIDVVAFLQSTYSEYLPNDYDPYFP